MQLLTPHRRFNSVRFCSPRLRARKASALLVAFFLMSVMTVLALGTSAVILEDLRAVKSSEHGLQSWYAAEGLKEKALLLAAQNSSGYEIDFEAVLSNGASGTVQVRARSTDGIFPCSDEGEVWRPLEHNESVQIPLFAVASEAGNLENIHAFYVEFFVADEAGNLVQAPTQDVLRWKILGLDREGRTEAMSEYIPLYGAQNSAEQPTLFGTSRLGALPPGYQDGKFFSRGGNFGVYPIRLFVENHARNTLILTNVIQESGADSVIYFRLHGEDAAPVCEYTEIQSSGFTEGVLPTQTDLETFVREGENLPVFDFVIYHTR